MTITKLIPMKDLRKLIPYSSTHIYRLIKQNKFPKPIRLGVNRVAWKSSDIEAWIEERETKDA